MARPPWSGTFRPVTLDLVLAGSIGLASIGRVGHDGGSALGMVLSLALATPLVARRRAPEAVFGAMALVALVQWSAAVPLLADVGLLVALYTVASLRPVRTAAAAAAVL